MTFAPTVTKTNSKPGRYGHQLLGPLAILAGCLLFAATSFAQATADTVYSIFTYRGATQQAITSEPFSPAVPTAVAILLAGGNGDIQLASTVTAYPINATSVASNVLTVTVNNSDLYVGQQVYLQQMAESFLNGQVVTITGLTGTIPVFTGFTANFVNPDYSNPQEVGGFVTTTASSYGLDVTSNNFLVRSRWLFAGQGFYTITLNLASDFPLPQGLTGLQGSANHVSDVLAAIAWARKEQIGLPAGLPVWVVGTSRGTAGAFVAGQYSPGAGGPDGLVFADSINDPANPDSLAKANLPGIVVPVLLLQDAGNGCMGTMATGESAVVKLLTSSPLVKRDSVASAGLLPLTDSCKALSDHGFFGKEPEAVAKIAAFIKSAPLI